jgi:hypothetical protein
MTTTFESKIVAVQLTLDAAEVRRIAISAREEAEDDLNAGMKHAAEEGFRRAAWYYRAIGDEWYAERMDGRAKAALVED